MEKRQTEGEFTMTLKEENGLKDPFQSEIAGLLIQKKNSNFCGS